MPAGEAQMLTFAPNTDSTSWIGSRLSPRQQFLPLLVGNFIPNEYSRYIRISHPLIENTGQRLEGMLEDPVLEFLITILEADSAGGSGNCWFAFWRGWGRLVSNLQRLTGQHVWESEDEEAATFSLDAFREYVLLAGSLNSLLFKAAPGMVKLTPQLWWPESKAWFVSTDIDLTFTLIGADDILASILLSCRDFESRIVHWKEAVNP